ncbi:hemin uptake protein HemP [Budvicia aquatica]|uniref:Hemin uptake protein n=1 Tax=Budvicia aquatica TaxID=82979 RepID=A0A2C6DGX2_9GAMM|nr:hemin uptake protein HemP [Budvicia aquatica]PHI28457.1 hemin uptake protein HemP [Budvicia aquatica]VFS46384.1 Hemin uptake protein [Budvicia aquatica]
MKIPDREDSSESLQKKDSATQLPLINSRQLLGASGILLIQHQDQQYQLRITKAGKLILTK